MPLIRLNRNPSRRDLRVFAAAGAALSLAAAAAAWRRGHGAAAALWAGLAAGLGILAGTAPASLRGPFVALSVATYPIGWVLSHAVLILLYFGVITPAGLVMRRLGRDPLQRRFDPSAPTYWRPRTAAPDKRSYFNQS